MKTLILIFTLTFICCSKQDITPSKPIDYTGNWVADDVASGLHVEFTTTKVNTTYYNKITFAKWKGGDWTLTPSTDNNTIQYDSSGYLTTVHTGMTILSIFFVGCKVDKDYKVITCKGSNYLYDNSVLYFLTNPIIINRKL